MRKINLLFVVITLTFMTSSCFLFRPSHERCPAYGSDELDNIQLDKKLLDQKIEQI